MKFSAVATLLLPALVTGSHRGLQELVKVETDFNCLINCTVSPGPGDCFQLTDAAEKQSGVVWSNRPLKIVNSFVVEVQMYFGTNDGPGDNGEFPDGPSDPGADGVAFVLQNQGPETVGRKGGGLGFSEIDPSLGVEFDTYQNKPGTGDPAADHLALVEDGELSNGRIVEPIPLSFNLEDGTYHDVTINWKAQTRTLNVAINGTVFLTHSGLDLTGILGSDFAYLGFTSSTGDSTNRHEVCVSSIQGTIYQSDMPSVSPSLSFAPSRTPSSSPTMTSAPSTIPTQVAVGSISGSVKEDTNNDEVGDANLANVLITLLDESGGIVATVLTDSVGEYSFNNLPLASYVVAKANIPGYLSAENTIHVMFTPDGLLDSTSNDFVEMAGKTISGIAVKDTDNNGVGDTANIATLVELVDSNDNSVALTVTDSNGMFAFDGVHPGVYTVVETNNAGLVDVMDSDGGDPNKILVDVTSGSSSELFFVDAPMTPAPAPAAPIAIAPTCGTTKHGKKHAKNTNTDDANDEEDEEDSGKGGKKGSSGKSNSKSGAGKKRGLRRLGKSGDNNDDDDDDDDNYDEEVKSAKKGKAGECDDGDDDDDDGDDDIKTKISTDRQESDGADGDESTSDRTFDLRSVNGDTEGASAAAPIELAVGLMVAAMTMLVV